MNEHLTTLNLEGCDPLQPTSGLSVVPQRILPSNTDPLILASRVAERIHLGVRSMIDACILINEGVKYFEADREMLDQFRKALVNAHVIPSRSARLGDVDKSKLSMLRKIGEYADLLLEEKLFKFLEPGRSILYHVIRLHELLLGNHQDRIARLVELFEAQGSLTRGFLIDQINLAKRASEADSNQVADPWASAASDQDFDSIVATLADRRDVRRLAEDYPDRSPLCLRIHEHVAKNAVGFFFARIADLPVIENKLLPGCGFSGMSRVFLVRGPLDADITDAEVIVMAERGPRDGDPPVDFEWFPHGEALDAVSLASRLAPNAANRLHLFATADRSGCTTVVGEANWSQTDE
jgi:hypothetical protein